MGFVETAIASSLLVFVFVALIKLAKLFNNVLSSKNRSFNGDKLQIRMWYTEPNTVYVDVEADWVDAPGSPKAMVRVNSQYTTDHVLLTLDRPANASHLRMSFKGWSGASESGRRLNDKIEVNIPLNQRWIWVHVAGVAKKSNGYNIGFDLRPPFA